MRQIPNFLPSNDTLLTVFVVLAYAVGVLSTYHNLPSLVDFLVNLQSGIVLFFGLSVMLILSRPKLIGLDSLFWLAFFILLLIQPLLHTIPYPDALIFPLEMILGCFLTSILANNISNKQGVIITFAYGVLLVGLTTVILQLLQYYGYRSRYVLKFDQDYVRFYGNLGQPNQTAFVLALAVLSNYFLVIHNWQLDLRKKRIHKTTLFIGFILSMFVLSVGIALTSSRAGIIFGLFLIFLPFFVTNKSNSIFTWQQKLLWIVGTLVIISLGYSVGIWLLETYEESSILAATNRSVADLNFRIYLMQQAWLSFESNPLIGVGWNNFLRDSLNHISQLNWFPFAVHSHNVIGQIAAEYGLIGLSLCLIPIFILIKNLFNRNGLAIAYVLLMVGLVLLYSLSEFPLWIFKYLFMFSFMFGLLNKHQYTMSLNFRWIYVALAVLSYIGGLFYYHRYIDYSTVAVILNNQNLKSNNEEKDSTKDQEMRQELLKIVNSLPMVFGFSDYKEIYVYQLLPLDNRQIAEKIALGNRILSNRMTHYVLTKQATYYGLNNQNQEALLMFKGACLLYQYQSCGAVSNYMKQLTMQNNNFINIYQKFNQWIEANPEAKAAIIAQDKKQNANTTK